MVDLSSPLRFGVKWLLDAPSPPSPYADLINYPINNPIENTNELQVLLRTDQLSNKISPT